MSSPITCGLCEQRVAVEAAMFVSGDVMALCSKCLDEAEEFITNTGCLAD